MFNQLTKTHFPRDSWLNRISELAANIATFESYLNSELIENQFRSDIRRISRLFPINLDKLRTIHETEKLADRKNFFDTIEAHPLTLEQRLGVLRSNNLNMVLAAAGTGKTSVIVAKIFDIIERNLCKPDEILVMAYNRAAALEVQERVKKGKNKRNIVFESEPEISTFHALGRKILKNSGITPNVSKLAEDSIFKNAWITNWLQNFIIENVDNFLMLLRFIPEPFDPFQCENKAEYERSIRDNEFRTLLGEKVKGYQEMLIANYLCIHGVKYKYEEPYVSKRRIENNVDYKPDFHISDTNVYIEHFGIDRNGNTRPDIDKIKYNQDINLKRKLHQEHETTLIETYHYEWKEGVLLENLEKKLKAKEIAVKMLSQKEIDKLIKENKPLISKWGEVLGKALEAIRVENLDEFNITQRLNNAKLEEADLKAKLLARLVKDYQAELNKTMSIDFDDMILKSSELIEARKFKPSWKYILVDEFQDISTSRMTLVKKLVKFGPTPSLTVVGDDWQAIYRFSGGKLEFTTKFSELVGKCSSTYLRKTFRYHDNIADVSERFITTNPNQIKKNVEAHEHVEKSLIFLHDNFPSDKYLILLNKLLPPEEKEKQNYSEEKRNLIGKVM